MYAKRKGWNVTRVLVEARLALRQEEPHIDRSISLHGELDASQTARLLEVSERTPVTLVLKGGIQIRTTLVGPGVA
jgi:putative redox protein